MLYLIKFPEEQEKMFRELLSLTGGKGERRVNLGDRAEAHFTNALIDEVTRHCPMATLPPAHKTMEDVVLKGMRIPKGTQVPQ